MSRDFPRRESLLLPYAHTFSSVLSAGPSTYGCTAGQATSLAALVTTFDTTFTAALDPATRTKAAVADKNSAKKAMLASMSIIAAIAHATPTVTPGQLILLGLTPRAIPTPINPPTEVPVLLIKSVLNRTLKIQLKSSDEERRGLPKNVSCAAIYSYVGATPPVDTAQWVHQGNVTRTSFEVSFPGTTPAGAQVWLVAMWCSPRQMYGPPCSPVSAYLAGGVVVGAAA